MTTEESGQLPQRNGVVATGDVGPRTGYAVSEEISEAFLHTNRHKLEERTRHMQWERTGSTEGEVKGMSRETDPPERLTLSRVTLHLCFFGHFPRG